MMLFVATTRSALYENILSESDFNRVLEVMAAEGMVEAEDLLSLLSLPIGALRHYGLDEGLIGRAIERIKAVKQAHHQNVAAKWATKRDAAKEMAKKSLNNPRGKGGFSSHSKEAARAASIANKHLAKAGHKHKSTIASTGPHSMKFAPVGGDERLALLRGRIKQQKKTLRAIPDKAGNLSLRDRASKNLKAAADLHKHLRYVPRRDQLGAKIDKALAKLKTGGFANPERRGRLTFAEREAITAKRKRSGTVADKTDSRVQNVRLSPSASRKPLPRASASKVNRGQRATL